MCCACTCAFAKLPSLEGKTKLVRVIIQTRLENIAITISKVERYWKDINGKKLEVGERNSLVKYF